MVIGMMLMLSDYDFLF